jgi:hypothetical protein
MAASPEDHWNSGMIRGACVGGRGETGVIGQSLII